MNLVVAIKLAQGSTEEEFVDFNLNQEAPLIDLTDEEMEHLQGGAGVINMGITMPGSFRKSSRRF